MQNSITFLAIFAQLTLGISLVLSPHAHATPSTNPDVLVRRGKLMLGTGDTKPTLTLTEPTGGWTSSYMLKVAGTCSDLTADPVTASINGVRYFIRSVGGSFSREFPATRGQNNVTVECGNKGGTAREQRTITGVMNSARLKVVLTSDTDGVYTDLHIYETDGRHVYWADTNSPTGGLFFLNQQGQSGDQPGYGPYLYVHPAPAVGVYRIDSNYWPGGAVQHTLANLDIVTDEGLPTESRRRVKKPLARPGETQTLAYVIVRGFGKPVGIYVPGQDSQTLIPDEVKVFKREVEPKIAKKEAGEGGEEIAFLRPNEEQSVRRAVVMAALSQGKKIDHEWNREQRDCAGLVRYAYSKALSGVDGRTSSKNGLWRTGFDVNGEIKKSFYADAETLIGHNFRLSGRELSDAKPGDLLAFKKDLSAEEPFHLMIYAGHGADQGSERSANDLVVYHTGSNPALLPVRRGFAAPPKINPLRIIRAYELETAADPVWIPKNANNHFLGVYQWLGFNPSTLSKSRPGAV